MIEKEERIKLLRQAREMAEEICTVAQAYTDLEATVDMLQAAKRRLEEELKELGTWAHP